MIKKSIRNLICGFTCIILGGSFLIYTIHKKNYNQDLIIEKLIKYNKLIDYRLNRIEEIVDDNNESISVIIEILDILLKIDERALKIDKLLSTKIDNLSNKIIEDKINLEQTLKQVNVMIVNKTSQTQGSGVFIKYRDKFYILSAGHMLDKLDDEIYLYENNNKICKLEVIKHDYNGDINTTNNDLLLLRPINSDFKPKIYSELAQKEPITGMQIYVVGNPMGIEDIISDGRIIAYKDNVMYYIDHTYYGNSGGGVYDYNGDIIGIVSYMQNLKPDEKSPDYIINGAIRLDIIKKFLEGVE